MINDVTYYARNTKKKTDIWSTVNESDTTIAWWTREQNKTYLIICFALILGSVWTDSGTITNVRH